jgi:hypothetical protein
MFLCAMCSVNKLKRTQQWKVTEIPLVAEAV